ncbi:MAG: hypothetical protein M9890_00405 [Thermomicrobiales bacterium]|nr:hypothetical protein [Thermomicrobiales bacterium]
MRVAVVGRCASGKSTIAAALRDHGYDAWPVAQEHSIVSALWNARQPDALVLLDASLATVRKRRRNPDWPDWIYELQTARLANARASAHVVVNTDDLSIDAVVSNVLDKLAR